MGDSVGTTVSVSAEVLASRSSSERKRAVPNASTYRSSRAPSTPRVPQDPIAIEILQARQQQLRHRERALAIQNRIRLLQKQEEEIVRTERKQRQTQAFASQVRERRMQEEQLRAKVRSERKAEELESRIRHLRAKQQRNKQISTARSRILSERRETVEEIKKVCERIDVEIETRREIERLHNVDRRRAIERELKQVQEQRTLSASGHRELLKMQYRSRLEIEKQRAEEESKRMQELEKLQEEVVERVKSRSVHLA